MQYESEREIEREETKQKESRKDGNEHREEKKTNEIVFKLFLTKIKSVVSVVMIMVKRKWRRTI